MWYIIRFGYCWCCINEIYWTLPVPTSEFKSKLLEVIDQFPSHDDDNDDGDDDNDGGDDDDDDDIQWCDNEIKERKRDVLPILWYAIDVFIYFIFR